MALDHYVSQVHLKQFYSLELGERMYAIRKSDQKAFTPNSRSVCRIDEGSTNRYLCDERIIEEFLKGVEPKYNAAVSKVQDGDFDIESIYVIAGFLSYVISCSPCGMRIHSELFKSSVEESAKIIGKTESFPPPPKELGGESLTELLESGKIFVEIDDKYTQAHGIVSVLSQVATFGNSRWEILANPYPDSPFFTSDYPVAIERSKNPMVFNRVFPLTPTIAIRIHPNIHVDRDNPDYEFKDFSAKKTVLSRPQVRAINQQLVRCAETVVFFSRMEPWIPGFVKKNSGYRIEPKTHKIPHGTGTLMWVTQEITNNT